MPANLIAGNADALVRIERKARTIAVAIVKM
jgi:hypothetical protein